MSDLRPPRPDCKHTTRFTSIGGSEACEMCTRLDSGWKACKQLNCPTLVAPDERLCEVHTPAAGADGLVSCPDCKGQGTTECEEFDCHGEFCEDGYVYCDTCGGEGEIQPRKKVA